MRQQTILTYLSAGAVLLFLFAAAEVFILTQWYRTLENHHKRTALKEEILRLRRLASDIDNGFRGYVLTHNATFLAPMSAAERDIPLALARLDDLVADGPPSLQGRVELLKGRFQELVKTKRRLVGKIARGEDQDVLVYVKLGDGVALSKTLAASFDDVEDKIKRQFPSVESLEPAMQKRTLWQLVLVQVGTVLLGVAIVQPWLGGALVSRRQEL
ncbi:MAG TPA: CHASE3 domain-containing protein [Nitrospira sp.]|nr:CHASE3 domain-containing protein [Nitrospira sp.]